MKTFNSIDIETYGNEKITPYCFSIIYANKKRVSYGSNCIKDGLNWIFDNCYSNTVFFAHNLNFDGNIILNFLPNNLILKYRGSVLRRGDIYCLSLSNGKKDIFLKCSSKILPLPLSEIALVFNIPSKKFIDHSSVNAEKIKDEVFKNNVIEYCIHDSLIVSRFLYKISDSVSSYCNFDRVYSISGLSLKIFSQCFNIFKILLKTDIDFDNLIRPAYYGGRCEVFGNLKKDEKCYHFDFSGMYTNRLLEEYPFGEYSIEYNCNKIKKDGFYFISVFSQLEIPILPYRDKITKKLLFPNGRFSGLY
jgi:hypothetical protein